MLMLAPALATAAAAAAARDLCIILRVFIPDIFCSAESTETNVEEFIQLQHPDSQCCNFTMLTGIIRSTCHTSQFLDVPQPSLSFVWTALTLRSGTHQWSLCTDQRTSSSLTQYKWVQTSGTVADSTGPCTETTVPLVGRRSGPVSLAPLVVTTTGPCQTTESAATPVGGNR
ncbi:uncharacterized protein V6R79_023260 [Siganus canaliculatus]